MLVDKTALSVEFYTPEVVLRQAREYFRLLGFDGIEVDPATPEHNPTGAKVFWTQKTNGLDKEWASGWSDPEGNMCPCKCHSLITAEIAPDARIAGRSGRRRMSTSESTPGCSMGSIAGVMNVSAIAPERPWPGAAPTPSNGSASRQNTTDTLDPTRGEPPSGSSPRSTTTDASSARAPSPSHGPPTTGCDASRTGNSDAPIAEAPENSPRITSFPSAPMGVQEPSSETCSRPADPAITPSKTDPLPNGARIKFGSVEFSSTCVACPSCRIRRSAVWTNVPYGDELHRWVPKINEQAQRGHAIVSLLPGQRFDQLYWQDNLFTPELSALVLVTGRLAFIQPNGEESPGNPYGSMLYVHNGEWAAIVKAFAPLGMVIQPAEIARWAPLNPADRKRREALHRATIQRLSQGSLFDTGNNRSWRKLPKATVVVETSTQEEGT